MPLLLLAAVFFPVFATGGERIGRLQAAAEHYFSRYAFREAIPLWEKVWQAQPDHPLAVVRLTELKLILEGRAAARAFLTEALGAFERSNSADGLALIRKKQQALEALFLTDEGQAAYLQALPKIRRKEWLAALSLLQQAEQLERGNSKVLAEKARCERALGQYDRYYQTLTLLSETLPWDVDVKEELAEVHIHFRAFDKAAKLLGAAEVPLSPRGRLALGVALVETGHAREALGWLRPLVEKQKKIPHPVVYWAIGQGLGVQGEFRLEAVAFLERYLSAIGQADVARLDGWDPYLSPERDERARTLLTSLKAP